MVCKCIKPTDVTKNVKNCVWLDTMEGTSARMTAYDYRHHTAGPAAGNAVVHRAARQLFPPAPRHWCEHAGPMPHQLPEGDRLYEVVCGPAAADLEV